MAILRHSSSSYYYYYYLSGANRRWVLLGRDLARQPLLRGGSIVAAIGGVVEPLLAPLLAGARALNDSDALQS